MPVSITKMVLKRVGRLLRSAIKEGDDRPYQTYLYRDTYIEGHIDTVQLFYSLGISNELNGASWLDLGCNGGSTCILAASNGAAPVTGVDFNESALALARQHIAAADVSVSLVKGNIIEFVETDDQYDFVSMFALFRHVHGALLAANGITVPKSPLPYLVNSSFETLILGKNSPVDAEFREFLKKCLNLSRRYFFCSINDRAGLIVRRKEEVEAFFWRLSERIEEIEIYQMPSPNQDYTVASIRMSSS